MTSQPDYLLYLESAKRADLAARLQSEGFKVETDIKVGDVVFDLGATKEGKTIIYEFKSANHPKFDRTQFHRLQKAARSAGFDFRVVVVNPPRRAHVEVDRLAEQLEDYMINHDFPQDLDSLSTHTQIERISDVDIEDIRVGGGVIRVRGAGSVDVGLQYGSEAEDTTPSGDSFPFTFSATLSPQADLLSVEALDVDTSTFRE